jgi:hypothetical protein
MEELHLRIIAVIALALCLQPGIKLLVGILLGIRYSYVYLWFFEPRFKMSYGTYLATPTWARVLFQFFGSIGTPIALCLGYILLADVPWLSNLSLLGCFIATFMQIGAFIAYWLGIRGVGPFALSTLTTPATLAKEVGRLFGNRL